MRCLFARALLACATLACTTLARAEQVQVAVAANFSAPMQVLAAEFEKSSGHKLAIAYGSTGKFYAQIRNGAPYDVLLAADDETPRKLAQEGMALAETQFTYAKGRLVLWSAKESLVDPRGEVLNKAAFDHLALANPKLAPYGAAAIETVKALGIHDALSPKFVLAENIAQAYQFVKSGNAQLGFVALSQVMKDDKIGEGSAWVVPSKLHQPILQDAIVLDKGRGKAAALALLSYMRGEKSKALIRSYGYEL